MLLLTLTLIQTLLNPSRLLVLLDHSRLCYMTSRSCALPPLQTNNYYCPTSVLTLTLPKVCPHFRLITSDSYSDDNSILVCDSRSSSCPTYTITDYYCPNKKVYNVDLRRSFYSKQGFKNTCYFSAQTDHKWTCSTKLIMKR